MVSLSDAKDVSTEIINTLHPISIVVFGSVAQKGVGKDLDILVVIEGDTKIPNEAYLTVNRCLKPFFKKFAVDPFVISQSILNEYHRKGSPFLRLILKEGRSLYMKDDVVFIDSIYRGRYPAEVGLLPLGEPSDSDAQRALSVADNTYNSIQTTIQSKASE